MLLRRHQLCPIVMRSSAKTAWMSQQLLLLLLLLATTTFKQSEQRVLASKEGEADNNKDLLAAAEEGPEVVLPPFDYVPNAAAAEEDDVLGASSSSSFSQRLANAKARFIANQLAKAAGLAEELRPRTQRWLLRTEALKDHPILGAGGIGPGGLQWSKRVVSESELNSLLKNAWLGRK